MKTHLARALLLISVFTLVACGGSSGEGSGDADDGNSNDSGQGDGSASPSMTPTAEITQENTRTFAGSAYTFVDIHNTLISNFAYPLDPPSFSSSRNGSDSENCFSGGTMTNVVSENGAAESLTFKQCQLQNGLVLDGKLEISTSEADSNDAYDIEFSFSALTATKVTYNLNINGSAQVVVPSRNEDPFRIRVVSNLEAVDNQNGELYLAEDFVYELPMGFSGSLTNAENFSGGLGTQSSGMAVLKRQTFDIGDRYTGGSSITGVGDSFGVMQRVGIISDSDLELLYFATSSQSFSSAGVRLRFSDLKEGKFDFFSASNTPPKKNDRALFTDSKAADFDELITISGYSKYITDENGDLLTTGIELWNLYKGYGAEGEEIHKYAQIKKSGYGTYQIAFEEPGEWQVSVTATDPTGEKFNLYYATVAVTDSRDTDGDGIINENDLDDDNDGIPDSDDVFPLDATEDSDTDGDKIGNNADTDDDNDDVADTGDHYPLNPNCALESDGDGETCYIELIYWMDHTVDVNGIAYFWDRCYSDGCNPKVGSILRWDSNRKVFLPPLLLTRTLGEEKERFNVYYQKALSRLLVIFRDSEIDYFDLTKANPEAVQAEIPVPPYDWVLDYYTDEQIFVRVTRSVDGNFNYAEVFDAELSPVTLEDPILETGYNYTIRDLAPYVEKGYTINAELNGLDKFENETFIPYPGQLVVAPDSSHALDSVTARIYSRETKEEVARLNDTAGDAFGWTSLGIVNAGDIFDSVDRAWISQFRLYNESYELVMKLEFPGMYFHATSRIPFIYSGNSFFLPTYIPTEYGDQGPVKQTYKFTEIEVGQ